MNGKKEAEQRWQECSANFSDRVKEEIFDMNEVKCWRDIIYENVPKRGRLKILDIGTGPGFFAIIMTQDGHDATGIDCTPEMLSGAKKNAAATQVSPSFWLMDCHELEFEDDTFDLIITRNVTWTLYDPAKAYAEWKRVLKPGGRMLIFDAEWYMNFFDEEVKAEFDDGVATYREKYGDLPESFSMYLIEDYWLKLPLVGIRRPQWDKATLWKQGFVNIKTETGIDERVYTKEKSKLLYGATPMFMISADKPRPEEGDLVLLDRYWSSVALELSEDCLQAHRSDQKERYLKLLRPYLPKKPAYILDVGTGSGFLATLLAKEGYEVTGTDLSTEMLKQAKYCTKTLGTDVDFVQGKADKLPFPNHYFDFVICRNVTWLLQDPEEAFAEWRRVLRPGGRILYIDANWYLYLYDETERLRFVENRAEATKKGEKKLYGNGHSSTELLDRLSARLPFSKIRRPEWDRRNLEDFGFKTVVIKKNISPDICDERELLRTKATPMFLVCAEKY